MKYCSFSSIANFPNIKVLEDYQLSKSSILTKRRHRLKGQLLRDKESSLTYFSPESFGSMKTSKLSYRIKSPWWFDNLEDLHRNRVYFKQKIASGPCRI